MRTALWQQFGATIDMLENALEACPAALWKERLWRNSPDHPLPPEFPPGFAEFWYIAYHTLFWLDFYLSGCREEDFSPPAPFTRAEFDATGLPERPYTKEELHAYLATTRRKCHDTISALTDERAHQPVEYPWAQGQTVSFLELQFYNMRHVQEHAAQLSLFLGQHGIPDETLDWVPRAKGDTDSQ
ncbi:MAG TPA: DinB family protein [Ktedonobacteraceae bacterium]|nr:DinB family protein [Ktedonobacteraceae bacterium]